MNRTVRIVSLIALALSITPAATPSARAQSADKGDAFGELNAFTLTADHSGKCLQLNDVAQVIQAPCSGIQQQDIVWRLTPEPSGAGFHITSFFTAGNCLEVVGVSGADGAQIRDAPCTGAANQTWRFEPRGNGVQIVAAHSNKCMDVTGGSSADGAVIQQSACTGAAAQTFRITLPGDDYLFFAQHSTKCVEVAGASVADGANVAQDACDTTANSAMPEERWVFRPSGNGFQLVNLNSTRCMEVVNASLADGANVAQNPCGAQLNQEWRLQPSGVGFQLVAQHSQKCLDIEASSVADGANAIQFACTATDNQIYNLVLFNSSPVATNDVFNVALDQATVFDVLANDFDPDGDAFLVTQVMNGPTNGGVVITDGGTTITYTPVAGFLGPDGFDYQVEDPFGGSNTASVSLEVTSETAVQFIHGAPQNGTVDVYVADVLEVDDLDFNAATPYLNVKAGNVKLDVTNGAAADNSAPIFTTMVNVSPGKTSVAILTGNAGQHSLILRESRQNSSVPGQAEFFVANAGPDTPGTGIDLRQLDADNNPIGFGLANNLTFGQTGSYQPIDANVQKIQLTNNDNSLEFDVFRFEFFAVRDQTFTLVVTGLVSNGSLTLSAFDVSGMNIGAQVVTASDGPAEVPGAFTLAGNYPNPFNPSTTIVFDLPETARVSVEVIDLLGRKVLSVPALEMQAGARQQFAVDASSLGSGTYLYRVVAETATDTMVRTGRMTLLK